MKGMNALFYHIDGALTPWQDHSSEEEGLLIAAQGDCPILPPSLRGIVLPPYSKVRYCKVESENNRLAGTLAVPDGEGRQHKIIYALSASSLFFMGDQELLIKCMKTLQDNMREEGLCAGRLFCYFLSALIDRDPELLQRIEDHAADLETGVLSGESLKRFDQKMLHTRKRVLRLSHYYLQLVDMVEELRENAAGIFHKQEDRILELLAQRIGRLREETQLLREYLMQIREVYQGQIGIRQNEIMKLLTVVTVIFLPLTLLVGWYGMNFTHMPELTWAGGYPMVIALSVLIVVVLMIWFKKKKYW